MFLFCRIDQCSHDNVDNFVLQCVLSILQANPESKTFFVGGQPFSAIFIKQNNGLHRLAQVVRLCLGHQRIQQMLRR